MRLTRDQVRAVYNDPRTYLAIAIEYGVTPLTVMSIKAKKQRTDATDVTQPPSGGFSFST